MGYVCAFRGRRDSYQVPIALAEAGILDSFITDLYSGSIEDLFSRVLPERYAQKITHRFDPAIPPDRVRRLWLVAAAEALSRLAGQSASGIYERFDPLYGAACVRAARRTRSDLFMYSPHAWDAFRARYSHSPRKILFQFHPHHLLEDAILDADRTQSSTLGINFNGCLENVNNEASLGRSRGDEAWKFADHIVCASSFTCRSLLEVGARRENITIVPYGVDSLPKITSSEELGHDVGTFHALFVGSGLQRKGLHHILSAWAKARLPAGSRLTVVSRVVDSGFEQLLRSVPGISYLPGVTARELKQLYSEASLFVMPSLVEGFGQVYLEALSHGLPVLGTRNTCCPDLGTETDGVFLTQPGNIDELISWFEILSRRVPGDREIRHRARKCAEKFTWSAFREKIRIVAGNQQ
jgi:glycosyltransferase involved in cell wall biosynthesis